MLQVHGDALPILVPRHPERFNAVHVLCSEQFATVRRSAGTPVDAQTQVLLGDTTGELSFLYALADIAFVGGSLVAMGGHNLLQLAALALPGLMGPHVSNFLEISAMPREAGALQQGTMPTGWPGQCGGWSSCCRMYSAWARREGVMRANQGALQRLLEALGELLRRLRAWPSSRVNPLRIQHLYQGLRSKSLAAAASKSGGRNSVLVPSPASGSA
ncbi:hypothetical protein [Pseudomonas putida]|uniref:hypothetical protein n=1 Tax=Pseudomonas putida TaxID=303 RepID=UPI0018D6D860|nr:hypothetical protein [Pseudomonas putida]